MEERNTTVQVLVTLNVASEFPIDIRHVQDMTAWIEDALESCANEGTDFAYGLGKFRVTALPVVEV